MKCYLSYNFAEIYMRVSLTRSSLLIAAVLLMLLISFASAFALDMSSIEKHAAAYNSRVANAPYVLTSMLGSEKINLVVTRNNGTVFRAGMDMVSARIDHVVPGGYSDASIIVTTTESTINDVVRSKEKISEFKNMTDEGRIKFETNNWLTEIKLKAALSSASVLQFGYDLFFS
jgi:hypothetical protein